MDFFCLLVWCAWLSGWNESPGFFALSGLHVCLTNNSDCNSCDIGCPPFCMYINRLCRNAPKYQFIFVFGYIRTYVQRSYGWCIHCIVMMSFSNDDIIPPFNMQICITHQKQTILSHTWIHTYTIMPCHTIDDAHLYECVCKRLNPGPFNK